MGPSFRADVGTVLEHRPDLTIAAVARRGACSFATAWQVAQDYRLLTAAGPRGGPRGSASRFELTTWVATSDNSRVVHALACLAGCRRST